MSAEEVVKICDGKGAHGVFVTATNAQAYPTAPLMCRISGKVICIGLRKFSLPRYSDLTRCTDFVQHRRVQLGREQILCLCTEESACHRDQGWVVSGH
jgi:D-arabinose 1-dehydrogenase-like Zn-dependent alcohol dehydrogenase